MNVFDLRDQLIDEYQGHISSFIQIRDKRIRDRVSSNLQGGKLWPEPSVSLNPAFATGGTIDELVGEGVLHPRTADIFRIRKSADNPRGEAMRLYQHQVEAVRAAAERRNYVLTTGTGSGKSLTYIVPIVDHVLRNGTGRGVQAIVVYPMNSLANSQEHELDKFLKHGVEGDPPVKVRSYTGQQSQEERDALLREAPDVILTNYVMLELILTRLRDQDLVKKAQGLRFLVLDELHTYRGRQGADVALLVRRLRQACNAPAMQCVGTSATLATTGSYEEQRQAVAAMGTTMFGADVEPTDVIGETLQRATPALDPYDPAVQQALRDRVTALTDNGDSPPSAYEAFVNDPLSSWIESTLGVRDEDGRLTRADPMPLKGSQNAADQLRQITGLNEDQCAEAIQLQLMAGFQVQEPTTDSPAFAFRLHQFISKGDTVYSSLEPEEARHSTLNRQLFVPGHRDQVLLPLAFCRACGQEYYTVTSYRENEDAPTRFVPRELRDHSEEADQKAGFLFLSTTEGEGWPEDEAEVLQKVPDDWVDLRNGTPVLKRDYRDKLPRSIRVNPMGEIDHNNGLRMWWLDAPFRLCLQCLAGHSPRASDASKLTTLGTEGRSTVTTVLSQATVRALRDAGSDIDDSARKLLLFTDNRQDASLQAGHFNDFVRTVQLRGALYRALRDAGDAGLTHEYIAERTFEALRLPFESYSVEPDLRYGARRDTELTMQRVLGHLIYADLERGWRLTQPNLEQCGLLEIHHRYLDDICADDDLWRNTHAALAGATPEERGAVARALLDFLRRERAIHVDYLDADWLERLKQQSNQQLDGPWALGDEDPRHAGFALPRGRQTGDFGGATYVSGRGGFGRFLRRQSTFDSYGDRLSVADTDEMIPQLFEALRVGGLVVNTDAAKDGTPGYRVQASAMVWRAGSGAVAYHDQVRVPREPKGGTPPNKYFSHLYQEYADKLEGLEAAEHTAQVSYEERVDREKRFRAAELPVLYCSPTMELGIDIADLNVVGLRNVPPTPANYAQRSGRAGRSGQPALVFTYCSAGSPHDQWFFTRPHLMVSGQVQTPRLDLTNEDLVRSHVQAIWLSHSGLDLGKSLIEVMDVQNSQSDPRLLEHVIERLNDREAQRKARAAAERALQDVEAQLQRTEWWSPTWLDGVLAGIPEAFVETVERWRALYRAAYRQHEAQNRIALDASATPEARRQAARLRAEAERQLDLLRATGDERGHSDFYSYRYFASEGFLPGYSFPRLPLSAFVPGNSLRRDSEGNFVSRPRFLAISEFGPRALVYHEGSRYEINRVILPASERPEADTEPVLTSRAKRCERCGYVHDGEVLNADLCVHCGAQLPVPMTNLFRLQNVSTRRRDRINSDEEERQRLGFDLQTGLRFAERDGRLSIRRADVTAAGGAPLARLTYGETATLWRVNLGRKRRKNDAIKGFPLDVDRGYWAREKDLEDPSEKQQEQREGRFMRVVPYVEDSRNCLVLEPTGHPDLKEMASLQAALKNAIQLTFNLEDDELAAEPLPDPADRRTLLFYESAEGGAGVLRRLVEESGALADVATKALELCHFDPASGADQAHTLDEECVAACYDCLLSYRNQPDHLNLDRAAAQHHLLKLAASITTAEPVEAPVATGSAEGESGETTAAEQSEIERQWLDELDRRSLRTPDQAATMIEACQAQPDFLYNEAMAVVYVDGPPHEYPDRPRRDEARIASLRDAGYSVIRFGHADDWPQIFDTFDWVFGKGEAQ